MKTKVLLAVVALSYSPLAVARNEAAYPKENVAAFVVEKLDLTSLPSEFRPKKEKGKKTLEDQRKRSGVRGRETGFDFTAVRVPAEEGKRKEDTCGLRIHSAEDRRKRSHRRFGWSEEVGDQGSRPEILRNLRVCYGTRRKRGRYKGAKRRTAEKEDSEYVAKGARVVSRICCMSRDWWK